MKLADLVKGKEVIGIPLQALGVMVDHTMAGVVVELPQARGTFVALSGPELDYDGQEFETMIDATQKVIVTHVAGLMVQTELQKLQAEKGRPLTLEELARFLSGKDGVTP